MSKEPVVAHSNEPRRETFKQVSKLPNEPASDVAIEAGGFRLRERVRRINGPQGVSLIFTYTRLIDGNVEMMEDGRPIITDPHEVVIFAEDMVRVGSEATKSSLLHGREVAVARAVDHFKGLDALPSRLAEFLAERV